MRLQFSLNNENDPHDFRTSPSLRTRLRRRLSKYLVYFVPLSRLSHLLQARLRYPLWVYVVLAIGICWCLYYLEWKPSTDDPNSADEEKRAAVVRAFKVKRDAMGFDEYHPISKKGTNLARSGGIGYTVVDALDTMYLMGLSSEYQRARAWVEHELSFDQPGEFNTFETTIRVLGGLLSTYHLTSDPLFLTHAIDLADRLLGAFDSPSSTSSGHGHGLPLPSVNLHSRKGVPDKYAVDRISTAEAATLQLEFRYLAEITGNETYWDKVERVMGVIEGAIRERREMGERREGLVPIFMSASQGTFKQSEIRLGSRGDSYYEYLLKQYLQTMYTDAIQSIHTELVQTTPGTRNLTYIAELVPKNWFSGDPTQYVLQHKQDHLVCFLPGTLMLGATTVGAVAEMKGKAGKAGKGSAVSIPPRLEEELTPEGKRDWQTGMRLLETCMATHETATGLAPEIAMFRTTKEETKTESGREWYIKNSRPGGPSSYDARYMLRPETVESLFIAWRLTGDIRYRTYAWEIFTSIEKHAKVPSGGYATVLDVDTVPVSLDDKQETFFLSETLKYLYLIFSESSVLPLQDIVFNTEAHPLPVFAPTIKPRFAI
ncbi:glycoside hydrolase family 47 protein [Lentinula raphanica]|nr:glycoside hydrolase family 47 protein [Lentinula raphanica]